MKKLLSLLLAAALLLSLAACGGSGGDEPPNSETNTPDAQETQNMQGDIQQVPEIWTLTVSTDEFGDVTDQSEIWIISTVIGDFSNTATVSNELSVAVAMIYNEYYHQYTAQFSLLEYSNKKAIYHENDDLILKMKIDNDILEYPLNGAAPNGSLVLSLTEYDYGANILFDELYSRSDVRCIIEIGNSRYNFTVESGKFKQLCGTQGLIPAATELSLREAIRIYVDDKRDYVKLAKAYVSEHMYEYTLLNTEELNETLNHDFFIISADPVKISTENTELPLFPTWNIEKYTPTSFTRLGTFGLNNLDPPVREYKPISESELKEVPLAIADNVYSWRFAANALYFVKVIRITDDIYIAAGSRYIEPLSRRDKPDEPVNPDDFDYSFEELLFRCPDGMSETMDKDMLLTYISQDLLPQIP